MISTGLAIVKKPNWIRSCPAGTAKSATKRTKLLSTNRGKALPRARGQLAIFLDDARFAHLATSRWLVVVPA